MSDTKDTGPVEKNNLLGPSQEMSLAEWVDKLGPQHRVHKELAVLREKDSQIQSLSLLLDGKVLDKLPIIIVRGMAPGDFNNMATILGRLKADRPEMLNMMVLGISENQDIQTLSDADLAQIGMERKDASPVRAAALALRAAQKEYMADRGNDEKGKAVAVAAAALDAVLG